MIEVDVEIEIVVFVLWLDFMRESEIKLISIEVNGGRNEWLVFVEVVGLYL